MLPPINFILTPKFLNEHTEAVLRIFERTEEDCKTYLKYFSEINLIKYYPFFKKFGIDLSDIKDAMGGKEVSKTLEMTYTL
jgi:hypothetical protein